MRRRPHQADGYWVHELVHVLQQNKIDIHHVAQQADANSRASEYNRTAAHPTQRYSAVEMIQRTPSIASWDFHNSDRIAVDNCCGACRSGVRLGVDTNFYQSRTVTNGMELKAFISNHLPGATYDIKRVKESNVWERTGTGAWASLAHQGPGADDDPSDYDECLTPRVTPAPPSNTHHIYSLDQPGLLPYYPSSNTIVSASATEAVKKASFTEWVAITDTDGAGASDPNSYDWHMILWLTKESGGTWSVDTTRSEIEPGSVTVGTNGP